MKRTYILSTSLFALLLSAYSVQASDTDTMSDDDLVEAVATSTPAPDAVAAPAEDAIDDAVAPDATPTVTETSDGEEEFDPRDRNKDGKVSIGEMVHGLLDRNKDGRINFNDVLHALGLTKDNESGYAKLLYSIFDANGDGHINLDDLKGFNAKLTEMSSQFSSILDGLQGAFAPTIDPETGAEKPGPLSQLPANIKDPLQSFLTTAQTIATSFNNGSTVSHTYIGELQTFLATVLKNVTSIGEANFNATDLSIFKEDMAAVGSLVSTMVPNEKIHHDIDKLDKKLAKIKPAKA